MIAESRISLTGAASDRCPRGLESEYCISDPCGPVRSRAVPCGPVRARAGRDEGEIGEQAAQPNGVTNDPCRSGRAGGANDPCGACLGERVIYGWPLPTAPRDKFAGANPCEDSHQ